MFYCIFDQINAALINMREFFQKRTALNRSIYISQCFYELRYPTTVKRTWEIETDTTDSLSRSSVAQVPIQTVKADHQS